MNPGKHSTHCCKRSLDFLPCIEITIYLILEANHTKVEIIMAWRYQNTQKFFLACNGDCLLNYQKVRVYEVNNDGAEGQADEYGRSC